MSGSVVVNGNCIFGGGWRGGNGEGGFDEVVEVETGEKTGGPEVIEGLSSSSTSSCVCRFCLARRVFFFTAFLAIFAPHLVLWIEPSLLVCNEATVAGLM